MTQSAIEWTDRSDWNPVRGCTRVTEACRNCYAENIAGRFCGAGQPFEGFATKKGGKARWTGKVKLQGHRLLLPLQWRKPAKIFVNSASDIFHESLPDSDIDKIFAVMALCPQHTFQILTKRPERMRDYFYELLDGEEGGVGTRDMEIKSTMESLIDYGIKIPKNYYEIECAPLSNVWLGVFVHDQASADEFVPLLLNTPAAKRFVSYEPALGPVDWTNINDKNSGSIESLIGFSWDSCTEIAKIDQIIFGGESGPNARPAHPDWARNTQRQCAAAGTAFYFKQWGECCPVRGEFIPVAGKNLGWIKLDGSIEWDVSKDRCFEMADEESALGGPIYDLIARVGKKRAGSLLDGVEYSEMPV